MRKNGMAIYRCVKVTAHRPVIITIKGSNPGTNLRCKPHVLSPADSTYSYPLPPLSLFLIRLPMILVQSCSATGSDLLTSFEHIHRI